ncbi:SGNH hydrolase-type esterase domain-containing protein [Flagelloscypha sp. PMI_526]|nr:SGNH hydrolase-type esterase domain-containing protein [Flagelloscypha sp. PMI_526]
MHLAKLTVSLTLAVSSAYAFTARAMPLGDSITFGVGSSDGNSYRKVLQDTIVAQGNVMQYIGSVNSGNMTNNANEGHSGAIIDEIKAFAAPTLPQRPNLVFIHAGTNDVNRGIDLPNAPNRLMSLVDSVTAACPDAAVLVASIILIKDTAKEANANAYNDASLALLQQRIADGAHIVHVPMESLQAEDLGDTLHPNDAGYQKMAAAWAAGIEEADTNGWILDPVVV